MTTIRDVAAKAGVSVGTVSHVLSGARTVSPITAERVREAMSALDYSPNWIAQSLRGQRTCTVGLVVPDNANPFFAETSWAIERACADAGFGLMLCNTGRSAALEARSIEILLDKRVDGIIVATSTNPVALRQVVAAGVPLVVLDADVGGLGADAVLVDHRRGGELAARHLIELGHRGIACITGLPEHANASRIQGFRSILAEAGVAMADERLRPSDTHATDGYRIATELLERDPGITAIFAANDLVALGAMRAGFDLGRPVPAALSVVGFDDIALAEHVFPRLTTVRQPLAEIGRRAIEVLRDRIGHRNGPVERWVLPVELMVRESSAPVGGDGTARVGPGDRAVDGAAVIGRAAAGSSRSSTRRGA